MEIKFQILYFLGIIVGAIVHEFFHGWAADRLGDPTARYAGRLTINPLVSIDLWGTIILPILLYFVSGGRFVFGYAKPVPYNPYNLKNQRWGPAIVAIAGPLSNLVLAFLFAVIVRFFPVFYLLSAVVLSNIVLFVFNLVPIPPLDGSKILYALLPASANNFKMVLDRYGFIILIFFILFLFRLISPIIESLFRLLVGV